MFHHGDTTTHWSDNQPNVRHQRPRHGNADARPRSEVRGARRGVVREKDAATRRPVEETAGPTAAPRYWHVVEWLLLSTAPACRFALVICKRGSDAWSKSGSSWWVCRTRSNSHAACAVWRSRARRRRCTGERCSSREANELPARDPCPSVRSDHALAVRRDGDRWQRG